MKTPSVTLIFTLSMPNNNSWNGRWSGEGKSYAIRHKFTTSKAVARAQEILAKRWFSYNFGDGWRASIDVKEVDAITGRKIMAKSQGFCGYDWMVQSILKEGAIYGPTQPKPACAVAES